MKFINKYIFAVSIIEYPTDNALRELSLLSTFFQSQQPSHILHIHLVGDGKAGKSVAAKWIIDLFEKVKCKQQFIPDSNFHHVDVRTGRTRGVQLTTVRFEHAATEDSVKENFTLVIHDYGGQ